MAQVETNQQEQNNQQSNQAQQGNNQNSELQRLRKQNQQLTRRVQQMQNMMSQQIQQQPQQQQAQPQQQQTQEKEDNTSKIEMPPDFDQMNDRELVEWIIGAVTDQVDNKVEPVREKTEQLIQEQTKNKYQQQIQEAARKYDDFWDYSNQAAKLAKQVGGNITAEQAYLLAKSQSTGLTQQQIKNTANQTGEQGESQEQTPKQGGETQEEVNNQQPQQQQQTQQTVNQQAKQFAQKKKSQQQQVPQSEKPGTGGGTDGQEQGRFGRKEAIEEALSRLNK